jgi:hypothetical protein
MFAEKRRHAEKAQARSAARWRRAVGGKMLAEKLTETASEMLTEMLTDMRACKSSLVEMLLEARGQVAGGT